MWKKILRKKCGNKFRFSLLNGGTTHEWTQQISVQSVQSFGRLYATYIYIYKRLVLLYR